MMLRDENSSGEAKRARERNREDLRRAEWLGGVSLCAPARMTVLRELYVAATWNVGEMLRARLFGACSRYMLRAMTRWPLIGRHVRAAGAGQSGTRPWYRVLEIIDNMYNSTGHFISGALDVDFKVLQSIGTESCNRIGFPGKDKILFVGYIAFGSAL